MKSTIKKIMVRKVNNFLVLLLVSLISISLPTFVVLADLIGANSASEDESGKNAKDCSKVPCPIEFSNINNHNEIQSFDIFEDAEGKPLAYLLQDDSSGKDRAFLISQGIPENMIISADDLKGLSLPKGSIDNEKDAKEWSEYYTNLKNDFAIVDASGNYSINPNSDFYKLGVALGLYTGDVKKDTKNLKNGNSMSFNLEKATVVKINGKKTILKTSNADDLCANYINNDDQTGDYCRAIRGSKGIFSDYGYSETIINRSCITRVMADENVNQSDAAALCCIEKYGASEKDGKCCLYFHTSEECNKSDQPNEPEPVECSYNPVEPTVYPEIPKNTPKEGTIGCGKNYTYVTYDYTQTMCDNLVVLEKQTTVAVNLAGLNKKVFYAGTTFNWDDINSYKTEITSIYDTSPLKNAISIAETTITNANKKIEQLTCEINNLNRNSCINVSSENLGNCYRDRDKKIEQINADIESIKNSLDYLNAVENLKKYTKCTEDVANYKTKYESSTNVANINSEYMLFSDSKIKYNSGEVVAIQKNNGNPLTAKDLTKEILADGNYLNVKSDFYIPISIKNGTSGLTHRDVVLNIDNKSISYDCPLNVTNNIRCYGKECNSKGINIIYRPISLTNPFPSKDKTNNVRMFGDNWSTELMEQYILNNRNVKDYNVYNLKPLYTITLNPSIMKEIRKYNKNHSMNDFNMVCNENGYGCISRFLWEEFDEIIDTSKSCASSSGLDQTCYNGGVSE